MHIGEDVEGRKENGMSMEDAQGRKPGKTKPSAVRDFPLGCGRFAPPAAPCPAAAEIIENGSTEDSGLAISPPDKFPPQALSASRDFPLGCGRAAREASREECLGNGKPSRLGKPPKSSRERARNRTASSKCAVDVKESGSAAVGDEQIPLIETPLRTSMDHTKKVSPKVQHVSFALTPSDNTHLQSDGTVTRSKVRETLRLFQALCRKFLQEEESHAKESGQATARKRPDLLASKMLKEKNMWVNTGKQIAGHVPGVEVGDEFHYRMELLIVGLHRQSQGGIDYLKQGNTIFATSIVASGGYAGDVDSGEVLIYTGQGGNNSTANKRQAEDQKLERGNLSLKNCIDAKAPVRVIRGIKDSKQSGGSGSGKDVTKNKLGVTYTYDGLYLVEKYWLDRGTSGSAVFKFQLRRMAGQPELAWNIVKSVGRSKKFSGREGLRLEDISQGKETRPIPVVNTIDDDVGPAPFEYTATVLYPSWYAPPPQRGCDCIDGCSDSENCLCAIKNGGELPFNYNGAIVEAKPLVYECGLSCKCSLTCHNRVSQHGVRFPLEVFKTDKRGWGVRSLSSISSGSFICEYTGELLSDTEAEQRTGNDEYLFDIGNYNNDQSLFGGLSDLIPGSHSNAVCEVVENVGYTIDAAKYGSVGRFINHSCSPNCYAQNVLYDHDDKNVPHIMLFAAENIPPLQELSYHYNYKLDQVRDSDGNIKKKDCYCGSVDCSGRLY